MKEKTLAAGIVKAMTLSEAYSEILQRWDDDDGKIGQGACLGDEVKKVAEQRSRCLVSLMRYRGRIADSSQGSTSGSRMSIAEMDLLLDELACHSPFSNLGAGTSFGPAEAPAEPLQIVQKTLEAGHPSSVSSTPHRACPRSNYHASHKSSSKISDPSRVPCRRAPTIRQLRSRFRQRASLPRCWMCFSR